MRKIIVLALALAAVAACGGGAAPQINATPAVTSGAQTAPSATSEGYGY